MSLDLPDLSWLHPMATVYDDRHEANAAIKKQRSAQAAEQRAAELDWSNYDWPANDLDEVGEFTGPWLGVGGWTLLAWPVVLVLRLLGGRR